MAKVLVSSCLLGCKVRYDGNNLEVNTSEFDEFIESNDIISFCPEVAGGLPIPRIPAEICGGTGNDVLDGSAKILGKDGSDVTKAFLNGAELTLKMCLDNDVEYAVLTESSPSCGSSSVYNGKFEGVKVSGKGVTCTLLENHGIKVTSQHQLARLKI
ncbi:DUF523 domain-containing protein [Aliivibrio sp. S2TY2]|uniref:DUF523 domain-containing protein n=1 Tax=unclassified Aliivibrio TaxID=2645654 RepID=UPI0023796F2A|nr:MULTISPECIES: DUF523 domain-containing protein [unclassified Aliivibrio]MDD9174019.1 DUF523 domain-containing protein [Aliivibrio sp. S3TY1]MDD9191096.1 DUF523 domain-containing protein [Aliivibrio sp. S2TY2]